MMEEESPNESLGELKKFKKHLPEKERKEKY